jgi:hypothetical protein
MQRVRVLLAATSIMVAAVIGLAGPVHAAGRGDLALNRLIDGSFTGSGTIDFSNPACDGIYSEQDYTYGAGRTPNRSGTVHAVGCVDTSTLPWTVSSTFTITSRTGATLSGTIVGTATSSSFSNTYTVTGGTRQFRNVSGTILATATFSLGGPGLTDIEGTYVAQLHR